MLRQQSNQIRKNQENDHNGGGNPESNLLNLLCLRVGTQAAGFALLFRFSVDTIESCNKKADSEQDKNRLVRCERRQVSDPCPADTEHYQDKWPHAANRGQQGCNNRHRAKGGKKRRFVLLTPSVVSISAAGEEASPAIPCEFSFIISYPP